MAVSTERMVSESSVSRMPRERVRVLDIDIDKVTNEQVLQIAQDFIESGGTHQIITANVDFDMLAKTDTEFRDIINEASLCVADGMPLVWASKLLGSPLPERINGTNMVYALCREGQKRHYRFFLLGAEPEVNACAAETLAREFPGIEIAGNYSPPFGPFSEVENARIAQKVRDAKADILLVAMGPPKAQKWIAEHQKACQVPVAIGIGGALDFVAGKYKRAPVWMQDNGLEWFFRLCVDYKRLWRRYLLRDMPFVPLVLIQSLKHWKAKGKTLLHELIKSDFERNREETEKGQNEVLSLKGGRGNVSKQVPAAKPNENLQRCTAGIHMEEGHIESLSSVVCK
jgi:N-acetylglucosaminyldiphosphoundecaprenol N-acetyl-beta-D-mannosaminyltransferase